MKIEDVEDILVVENLCFPSLVKRTFIQELSNKATVYLCKTEGRQ